MIYKGQKFEIHYELWGDPADRPVLFFHGFPGSHIQARPLVSHLAEHEIFLISADRPGYGGTIGVGTAAEFLDDLRALLKPLAELKAAWVTISVTTLDDDLCAVLEPRTSRPRSRLKAIEQLSKAGIPTSVNVAPCIPSLTDHEMPAILKAASEAGAVGAGYTPVRLPLAVTPIFEEWLEVHRPERKEKVLANIRDMRGGKLNDGNFGSRMRGQGPVAANIKQMFDIYTRKYGLNKGERWNLSSEHFCRPGDQLALF